MSPVGVADQYAFKNSCVFMKERIKWILLCSILFIDVVFKS